MAILTPFFIQILERVGRGVDVGVGAPLIWASTLVKEYTITQTQCGIVVWKKQGSVVAMVIVDRYEYFAVSCVCDSLYSHKMVGEYIITDSLYVGSTQGHIFLLCQKIYYLTKMVVYMTLCTTVGCINTTHLLLIFTQLSYFLPQWYVGVKYSCI